MRKNKGITLIALVITIIVLLILAGVAIAMLSGENGILKKAAEAKTKTENAQKQEEARLTDMELTTYFATNNLKYKCSNGYITGFGYGYDQNGTFNISEAEETVKKFEKVLEPLGYKINLEYDVGEEKDITIEESEKETKKIATGMSVQKDGKTVARTILYGDVNGDGIIGDTDADSMYGYYMFLPDYVKKDFQIIACDVNHDGEVNEEDANLAYAAELCDEEYVINQNKIVNIPVKKYIKRMYKRLQEYINLLDKSTGYKFEYNEDDDTYKLKGVKKDTTVENLINALPDSENLNVVSGEDKKTVIGGSEKVADGYYLRKDFKKNESGENIGKVSFAYIEVEK